MFMICFAGVVWGNWKADKDECKKCTEGGGGPIKIVRTCSPTAGFSCGGLKKKEEARYCTCYCSRAGKLKLFYIIQTNLSESASCIQLPSQSELFSKSRDCLVVETLAPHQCDPGSDPGTVASGLSSLLVLALLQGF